MYCNTLLCGNTATHINTQTKEKKCASCKNKRIDRESPCWVSLEQQNEEIEVDEVPPQKPVNHYLCESFLLLGKEKFGVHQRDQIESYLFIFDNESEAQTVRAALNNAYKKGAASVLHDLNKFSVDSRRKNGILWGEGNTTQNTNF